jgi:hypothetical protein
MRDALCAHLRFAASPSMSIPHNGDTGFVGSKIEAVWLEAEHVGELPELALDIQRIRELLFPSPYRE